MRVHKNRCPPFEMAGESHVFLILVCLVLGAMFMSYPAKAQTQITTDCELQAVHYKAIHGGDLIYVNPLQSNGVWELCRYCGHWLVYIHGYYLDPETNWTSNDPTAWYSDKKSVAWNINKGGHPPFGLIRYS